MVDHATAKYLNDNIGSVLAKALAEMSVAQPTDGVDFLARWLRTHAEQEEAKLWREKEEMTLEKERAKCKAKQDEKNSKKQRRDEDLARKKATYDDFVDRLNDPETIFDEGCWKQLVDVARTVTRAQSVYLAKVDEDVEGVDGRCMCYTHASPGSEWMVDKVLREGVGVSWNALMENPEEEVPHLWRPPKPEPAVPAEPADEGDAVEPPAAAEEPASSCFPVIVECVTDVPEMHYFDMTRLGAYVAVPLVYSSFYTPQALEEAKKFEREKKEAAKASAEAAAAEGSPGLEAGTEADGGQVDVSPEDLSEKSMILQGTPVKMLLCIDTLGTNASIDKGKLPELVELCKACGQCKERSERKQVAGQALFTIDEQELQSLADDSSPPKGALVAQCRSAVSSALQEDMEQEEQSVTEEERKELVQEKFKYLRARQTFLQLKDLIMELTSWVVVSEEMLDVIAATAFMYGYSREHIYPKRKQKLKWETLKGVLSDELFRKVAELDVVLDRKGLTAEQKLGRIKEMASPRDFDEEKAKEVAPAFEVMFTLIQAACSYRAKSLSLRKSEYQARKDAAEANGEPFTELPLEDVDDDFAEP